MKFFPFEMCFKVAAMAAVALVAGVPGRAAATEAAMQGEALSAKGVLAKLKSAYPGQRFEIEGDALVWPDGTRMKADDGKGKKPFDAWLADPDLADMLEVPYPVGAAAEAPALNSDPGRARTKAFFDKMYGDCRKGEVKPHLTRITWLKKKAPQTLEVTTVNDVAKKLEAVSDELDALPHSFDRFLSPAAGTYNCRVIAGTDRTSAHGAGIAIDIATRHSHYWRWAKGGGAEPIAFKNEIPIEIVRIFEKHGFIWGGRWYHYDTMHFEYRPELLF